MVDPIITYAFAALFFVALLGSMLYLTFMTPPREDEEELGKSVVGGAGAQTRSDDQDTAELAADTDADEVTEARDEETYEPDGEEAGTGDDVDGAESGEDDADTGVAADSAGDADTLDEERNVDADQPDDDEK